MAIFHNESEKGLQYIKLLRPHYDLTKPYGFKFVTQKKIRRFKISNEKNGDYLTYDSSMSNGP